MDSAVVNLNSPPRSDWRSNLLVVSAAMVSVPRSPASGRYVPEPDEPQAAMPWFPKRLRT